MDPVLNQPGFNGMSRMWVLITAQCEVENSEFTPESQVLEDSISFWDIQFSGANLLLVSGSVPT